MTRKRNGPCVAKVRSADCDASEIDARHVGCAAGDLRLALDASVIGERCGLDLDPWQAQLLKDRPRRALLNCSRQSGKSTVTALLALWTALFEAPALVVIVSPSQRKSAEMFRTVMQFRQMLDPVPELLSESVLKAEFKCGSRILALPGSQKTVRGLAAVRLCIIDEASQVADELITAVRPMLATVAGSLIALSTPFGRRGWYWEAWSGDDPSWTRIRVPADQCPRMTREFLDGELRAMGPLAYRQEYGLEFLDGVSQLFATELIEAAFQNELRALW